MEHMPWNEHGTTRLARRMTMVPMLTTLFFTAALLIAISAMVATIRPRLGRILFLLEHGPIHAAQLPPRAILRGRPVAVRVTAPRRLRAVA
jgi:hypothetical protein